MIHIKIWENYHPCKNCYQTLKYTCQRQLRAYFLFQMKKENRKSLMKSFYLGTGPAAQLIDWTEILQSIAKH